MERELDVADGAEVACQPRDFDPGLTRRVREGDRIGDLGRQRQGLRAAYGHHHRRVKVGAVEISQRPDGLTYLSQPLARWDHGQSTFAELVLNPWPAGADAHLEATVSEHRQRVRFPRRHPSRAQRGGIHPGAHPQVGKGRREGQAPAAIAGRRASAASSSRCRRCGARGLATPAGQLLSGQRPRIGMVWSCPRSSYIGGCLACHPRRGGPWLVANVSDAAAARNSSMPGQLADSPSTCP